MAATLIAGLSLHFLILAAGLSVGDANRAGRCNYYENAPPPPPDTTDTVPPDLPDACNTTYDAVALIHDELYIFKGKYHWVIGITGRYEGYPMEIRKVWRGLPEDLTRVDTVYERPDKTTAFFIGKQVYLFRSQGLLPGYPKQLTSLGLPSNLEKLDAAIVWGQNHKTYLYSGALYWQFEEGAGRVAEDYPRNMSTWQGVCCNIDSAITWKNGKTYFFKDKGFWKFDDIRMRVVDEHLRPSAQVWMRCPAKSSGRRT